jgi:DEAD/DEAH box helicase domain-containing protein
MNALDAALPAVADPALALADALMLRHGDRITGRIVQPARLGDYRALPDWLDPDLSAALAQRGITELYSHQAEALELSRAGRHIVVVTPTASGKSLCYHLPVLDAVRKRSAKALYLFPTKALAQDQVAELNELNRAAGLGVRAFTFDGDTPADARQAVRLKGDIVVSNPDMLHQGILPHHTKWAQFFENLQFVVIDEMHTYRGIFGSHVANVIRRLRRIAAFYGSDPRFILCSATLANPVELAEGLIGAQVSAIERNGAPCGARHLLLWNPPVINPDLGIRASNRSQTTRIARRAIAAGLKTIVFANSRQMVEVLTKYLKDSFERDIQPRAKVSAYRGGYLPDERRRTEQALRADRIDCVVTTSALELGVDIGSLDVCILNGYPGSIAGTWQRLGRAGRRGRTALGVLVASSDALDQYLVRNPDYFRDAPVEHARIAPDQLLILMEHLRCAAFELPFRQGEAFGAGAVDEYLAYLAEEGVLHLEAERWHWMADSYPANSVSLRSVADGNFLVIDLSDSRKEVIAEVDYSAAALTLYEGAIYLIQARPFQVERLDWTGRKAFVRSTKADYYTDAIDYTRLRILEAFETRPQGSALCARGEVHLLRRVPGFKKIKYYSHENVGYGNINLPDHEMHTSSLWWQVDAGALDQSFERRSQALDGFLGAAHSLHLVAALRSMAERQDLGRAVGDGNGDWFATVGADSRGSARRAAGGRFDPDNSSDLFVPTVFLYDNFPGGAGLSEPLLQLATEVVQGAWQLVLDCPCPLGCPACIGPILASDEQRGFSPKAAGLRVLELLGARAWI